MKEITWDYIDKACEHLANKIRCDGKEFEAVVGIPRGGLIIAVKISHLLDIPLKLVQKNGSTLLCDDICDSGLTMKVNKTYANTTTLSIHKNINSKFTPDYYYEEVDDFMKYPWETESSSKIDYKEKI